MRYIKFKISVIVDGKETSPEIPGYLIKIHDIPIVIHNWQYAYSCIIRIPKRWRASEYYSGCTAYGKDTECTTRKQIIKETTHFLDETIKRVGKKKVMARINSFPKINS